MSSKKIWWLNSQDQLVKNPYQITMWLCSSPRPWETFNSPVNLLRLEPTSLRRPSWACCWVSWGVCLPLFPDKIVPLLQVTYILFEFFSPKGWQSSCRSVPGYSNSPRQRNSLGQVSPFSKKWRFFTCWFGEQCLDMVLSMWCFF